ncbi:MAG: 5-methylcytosine restriction system specificity protein McrC, partial [Anaeroplasmataceae bacterium]
MKTNTLKTQDNKISDKSFYSSINTLSNKILNKTLEQLELEGIFVYPETLKESLDITKEQKLLESIGNNYKTSNLMGFIGYKSDSLIIESRFSNNEHDYFFQYLLDKVLEIPNIINLNTSTNQKDRLFNLYLFLFPQYLKKALRKGLFKTYINKSYNDSNVKGAIDIKRHIKSNIPFSGNVAYNTKELTTDNYIINLIRHTIEYIKMKPSSSIILNKIKEEVSLINSNTTYNRGQLRKIIIDNNKNIIRHSYYHEYKELQKLCIMILQHENHSIGFGKNEIYGVLFDGSWLFEEYINTLISDNFYHPSNKVGQNRQNLFNNNTGHIYPDFISKQNNIIADAKYKPKTNIANKDYLQILAYMFRFNSKKSYFIYPDILDDEEQVLNLQSG